MSAIHYRRMGWVLAMMLAGSMSASAMQVVKEGEAQAVIVIPDHPHPVVEYAAAELQYQIERATGARLAIVSEGERPAGSGCIYLGACQAAARAGIDLSALPPAGFVIKTSAGDLFLAGDDSAGAVGSHRDRTRHGTLWAVYDFLEGQMGVRWLWPGRVGEVIPETRNLEVAALDASGGPRFLHTAWVVPWRTAEDGWASLEARDQFFRAQDAWLLRHRFAATTSLSYGHAFGDYWRRFGDTHPEFFALLPNGKREPMPGDDSGANISMCVSQPGLWKQVVEDWSRARDAAGRRPFVNACENDTPAMCTCAACRAWDAPDPRFETSPYWGGGVIPHRRERFHGLGVGIAGYSAPWGGTVVPEDAPSLSDRYARFYLELQREARTVDPEAVVFGYAYANYWRAPRHVKLNPNIIISYVPPLWFPYTEEMSRDFRENWDGWRATGARLVLRPNLTHAGHNLPIFYARRLAADFAYAAQRGMIGTTFDSLLGAWATQGPTLYVLGRIHHHPEWPVDRILDEYYGAFGQAERQVREYFAHWEAASDAVTLGDIRRYHLEEGGGGFKDYVLIADRIFTPQVMAKGRELLEGATRAAAGDSLAEQRVSYLEKGLGDAALTLATLRAHKRFTRDPSVENERAYRRAMREMVQHRARVEADNVANMGNMAYRENRGAKWEHALAD